MQDERQDRQVPSYRRREQPDRQLDQPYRNHQSRPSRAPYIPKYSRHIDFDGSGSTLEDGFEPNARRKPWPALQKESSGPVDGSDGSDGSDWTERIPFRKPVYDPSSSSTFSSSQETYSPRSQRYNQPPSFDNADRFNRVDTPPHFHRAKRDRPTHFDQPRKPLRHDNRFELSRDEPVTAADVDPTRHIPLSTPTNALPRRAELPILKKRRIVGWSTVQLTHVLVPLHATPHAVFRSSTFSLRCARQDSLPQRKAPPFPASRLRKRVEPKVVQFAFTATKASVSKLAVVRNRARRRLKAAVELVVNRSMGLKEGEHGWDLVSSGGSSFPLSLSPPPLHLSFCTLPLHLPPSDPS